MKKTLITLAVAMASIAVTPAFAGAEPQKMQFTYEGVTYTYTKSQVGESTIYKGNATPGAPFYLVARKGQVTGNANGIPVSFKAPTVEVTASAKQIPLAAR
jgi:hypothetical protein